LERRITKHERSPHHAPQRTRPWRFGCQRAPSRAGSLSIFEPPKQWLLTEACLEEANGDAAFIAKALGDIARAQGMAQVARDAGLSRESLYKALFGQRSPGFDTILKVIAALGLQLHAEAIRS
jgi:probable addiction module antidote protein